MKLCKEIYKSYNIYPEKILQFGEGNFLRAFIDWQIDKMNEKSDFNGSIVIIQPIENGLIDMINSQNGLYTLYLQGIENGQTIKNHKIINSISRGINPYKDYDEYLKVGENPNIRFIISNTTEAGITFDDKDKLEDKPQKTYPGKLTALLYHRFKHFNGDKDKGFIIIPCELIDRNGEKLKEEILKYCELWKLENEFIKWINESNTFCSSLVDRIVPGYPKDSIDEITKELGYEDSLVDVGELFHLWVIEGPKWLEEELPIKNSGLNIKVVEDMTPYRTRKVRILNGCHTAMVPVSYLYGLNTVGQSVDHEIIGKFIHDMLYEEIIPTLDLPQEELKEFAKSTLDRFRNPYITHYLMSIALNSMSKYKTRNLPSLIEYTKRTGTLPRKLVFSLAALIEFYKGKRDSEEIKLCDDNDILELYKNLWEGYNNHNKDLEYIVKTVLQYDKLWGMDLNTITNLTELVTDYLTIIEEKGIKEAIKEVI